MPDLSLYVSPRACSLACHIALEESGLPYHVEIVKIREGAHREAAYLAVNPWGKIPALVIDDEVLTETHAILSYIGDSATAQSLLPSASPLQRARVHEWLNFLSSTVHIAFRILTRPQSLVPDAVHFPIIRETGIPNLRKTVLEVDRRLRDRTWALGDQFSVCDPYLLVFHIWSQREDIVSHLPELPHWNAHADRMLARDATWTCLEREGITRENIRAA